MPLYQFAFWTTCPCSIPQIHHSHFLLHVFSFTTRPSLWPLMLHSARTSCMPILTTTSNLEQRISWRSRFPIACGLMAKMGAFSRRRYSEIRSGHAGLSCRISTDLNTVSDEWCDPIHVCMRLDRSSNPAWMLPCDETYDTHHISPLQLFIPPRL